jgi:hypothetical protein
MNKDTKKNKKEKKLMKNKKEKKLTKKEKSLNRRRERDKKDQHVQLMFSEAVYEESKQKETQEKAADKGDNPSQEHVNGDNTIT